MPGLIAVQMYAPCRVPKPMSILAPDGIMLGGKSPLPARFLRGERVSFALGRKLIPNESSFYAASLAEEKSESILFSSWTTALARGASGAREGSRVLSPVLRILE